MGRKSRNKREAKSREYDPGYIAPLKKERIFTVKGTAAFTAFIAGLILLGLEVGLYRQSVINWVVPAFVCVAAGLIMYPITSSWLDQNVFSKWYWKLLFNLASFGGIATYSFMAINFYVTKGEEPVVVKSKIVRMGHLAKGKNGCGEPYVETYINGFEKQIVFGCDEKVEGYPFIKLTLREGIFGFDVIKDKQLSME